MNEDIPLAKTGYGLQESEKSGDVSETLAFLWLTLLRRSYTIFNSDI